MATFMPYYVFIHNNSRINYLFCIGKTIKLTSFTSLARM